MRVLVTGGAGFIGSHLVDALVQLEHEVVIVDDLSSGDLKQVHPAASFFPGDIAEEGVLGTLLGDFRPEVVFHLAAQASVGASWQAPEDDGRTNITGTLRVIAAALSWQAQVVYTSSAACYGQPAYLPMDEDHPTVPLSPYGVSKLCAEQYLTAYSHSLGLKAVNLRLANVYGPRQTTLGEAGVVASFMARAREGKGAVIHGDGEQSRDFVYVKDVVEALLASTRVSSGIFNIGTGRPCTVNQLWDATRKHFRDAPPPTRVPERAGDIRHSVFAPVRAAQVLNWQARFSLEEGLAETSRWYINNNA